MPFKTFNLYDAMSGGQNLALNRLKIDEAGRSLQARAGLQEAASAGTPEALSSYRKQFPMEAMDYEKKLLERSKGLREEKTFNQEQQKANTEWLLGATDQVLQNPGALPQLFEEGKRRGVIDAKASLEGVDMEQIKMLNQRAKISLGRTPDPGTLEKVAGADGKPQFVRRADALGREPYEKPTKPGAKEIYDPNSPTGTRIVTEADAIGKPGKKSAEGGFKAADTNAIRGLGADYFGGTFDPVTGRISGLSKDQSVRLTKLVTDASKRFSQGGMTHAEAFSQAIEELEGKETKLPPGLPKGSKQVGTSGGKPVYEAPNGKRYITE